MRKVRCIIIVVLFTLYINAEIFTIKDTEVFDFIEQYRKNFNFNSKINYLWTGTIIEINENSSNIEVKLIKSRWINRKELQSIKIILKTNNKEIAQRIKKVGINNKIVFICSVEKVDSDFTITAIPILFKEL